MICGIEASRFSTRLVIICGMAAIRTGIAAISPCANPVINCNAASISIGIFSTSVCTIATTTSTIFGNNCGNACPIPFASARTICNAPSTSRGRAAINPSIRARRICVAACAIAGSAATSPCTSEVIMSTAAVVICGRLATSPSTSPNTISVAKSVTCGRIVEKSSISPARAVPKVSDILEISPFAEAAPAESSLTKSERAGNASSPIGRTKFVFSTRPSPDIAEPKSSYLTALILESASVVVLISPLRFVNACIPSTPKSSHIVPNKATPAVFCAKGSSIAKRAVVTSSKAFAACSPPAAKAAAVSSAFKPISLNACIVPSDPSLTLIPNSFTASPSLSTEKVPASAPFAKLLNMSSASSPNDLKCTEYSLILSSKSPFLSRPFCAPCAIRLNASSPDSPN